MPFRLHDISVNGIDLSNDLPKAIWLSMLDFRGHIELSYNSRRAKRIAFIGDIFRLFSRAMYSFMSFVVKYEI